MKGEITLTGFTAELVRQGLVSNTRVLSLGYAQPDPAVRRILRVTDSASALIRLIRVRSVDGVPATVETSWLPTLRAEFLLDEPVGGSLFEKLRSRGVEPAHAVERLTARVLTTAEAGQLHSRAGRPAFGLERTTYDGYEQPIELARSLLRADRFTFVNDLRRPAGQRGWTFTDISSAPMTDMSSADIPGSAR